MQYSCCRWHFAIFRVRGEIADASSLHDVWNAFFKEFDWAEDDLLFGVNVLLATKLLPKHQQTATQDPSPELLHDDIDRDLRE